MKFSILIFLIITLLLTSVSAIKISLSPAHINLSGKTNTEICQKISLSSDKEVIFYGEDKWSLKNEKSNLEKYNLSSEDIHIKTSYPKQVNTQIRQFDFCVKSEKEGTFYGLLLYKSSTGVGVIGSLIKINISKEKTGKNALVNLSAFSLFLLLMLFLLFILKKAKSI